MAFNPDEITHADDASEALVASLNKYGRVEPHYMASVSYTHLTLPTNSRV